MTEVVIGNWGEDLALPIPVEIVAELGVEEGEEVDLQVTVDGLIVRRLRERK